MTGRTGSSRKGVGQRRGRAAKAHPPPTAGNASGTSRGPLVLASELPVLTAHAKLHLEVPRGALPSEADKITRAFEWYSMWKRVQGRNSPEAAKRDWCATVAKQARELRLALGHLVDASTSNAAHFRDGMQVLGDHWPDGESDGVAAFQLERAAWRIDPERMRAARLEGDNGVRTAWWHFMGERMPAALFMLEVIAQHGADAYAAGVKHGGRDSEHARRKLFCELAGSYKRLFGALPSISQANAPDEGGRCFIPSDPAMAWFGELFRTVQRRARKLGRWPGAPATIPDDDLDPEYRVIVDLAEWALSKGGGSDALASAIRGGATGWLNRPAPEPHDPTFEPTSLDEILNGRS